ncbi:MAG TPA: HAD-IB family phosphatase [Gemmatimonadaceae bacterium]|nr:HAD-IB family phosphatase [Gemmatimonadaceae bacterium]
MPPRFATVAFDADSTLSDLEGIDWLASLRTPALAAKIARLTTDAMEGRIAIEAVYGKRLAAIAPTRDEVSRLANVYCERADPAAAACVGALQRAGVRVAIVSGGLRPALLPMARMLAIAEDDVYGVPVTFGPDGSYAGFDETSVLTREDGKARMAMELSDRYGRPMLHIGDGMTDAATHGLADAFAAYVGFARRERVVASADFVVGSFEDVTALVLGS